MPFEVMMGQLRKSRGCRRGQIDSWELRVWYSTVIQMKRELLVEASIEASMNLNDRGSLLLDIWTEFVQSSNIY